MKRCKDCKFGELRRKRSECIYVYCHKHYRQIGTHNSCNDYTRKWWKFWIPKILLITLVLLLGGCVRVSLPDGTEYWRLGEQQIGEVLFTMPNGTEFLMVRQKSTIPVWIVTPAGWQLGEARKVKP